MRQSRDLKSIHSDDIGTTTSKLLLMEVTNWTTYDAAPVPFPPTSPPRMARSVGSSEGTTIPIHKAEPTKNTRSRQTNDLNAGGKILRGFSVSAATMAIYSGPVIL